MEEKRKSIWQEEILSKKSKFPLLFAGIGILVGLGLPAGYATQQTLANALSANTLANGLNKSFLPKNHSIITGLDTFPTLATQIWNRKFGEGYQLGKSKEPTVPAQFKGKILYEVKAQQNRKVIALTFDDGPSPHSTNEILYILDHYGIKATFFVLGKNVKNLPDRTRQVHLHGHAIGNHSWNHPYHKHSPQAAAKQIDQTNFWIEKVTGVKSNLFRPPGGFLNNGLAHYASQKGETVVMWSSDSKDYYTSTADMIKRVMAQARPGGIILFHDGPVDRPKTVAALPVIIEELQKQGYEFVTIPELMALHDKNQPIVKR